MPIFDLSLTRREEKQFPMIDFGSDPRMSN